MPTFCLVYGCNILYRKNDDNRQFFSFPLSNKELLEAWLRAIGRLDFVPTTSSKICSDHFLPSNFAANSRRKLRLKPDATPSVFEYPRKKLIRSTQTSFVQEHEGDSYQKKPARHDHDRDYDQRPSRSTNSMDSSTCLNLMVSHSNNQIQEAKGTNKNNELCSNTDEILSLPADKVELEMVIVPCHDKSTQTRVLSNENFVNAIVPKMNELVQKIQRYDEKIQNLKKLLRTVDVLHKCNSLKQETREDT